MTPVYWLSRHPHIQALGPWDTGMLAHLFAGIGWESNYDFTREDTVDHLESGPGGVVVLPARHHATDVEWLNGELAKLDAVLLILCGDEEAIFPWRDVRHPRIQFWVQLPDPEVHGDMPWAYFFGDGWANGVPAEIGRSLPEKDMPWAFSGQVTNERRKRAVNGLRKAKRRIWGELLCTEGFTQGMPRREYLQQLKRTWVAPCPGGPATHDTFRFFEALEASCVPVIEHAAYWTRLAAQSGAGNMPMSMTSDWDAIGGVIEAIMQDRHWWSNMWQNWYGRYRREMTRRLDADLVTLGLVEPHQRYRTTAVVTVSPSVLHPSLDMIVETINSARKVAGARLPVVIAADGVRPEQQHLRDRYEEFLFRLYWWAKWESNTQVVWNGGPHYHQAHMARVVLNHYVDTPNVLFLEHDTPLVTDEPLDFVACEALIEQRAVDVLRFHHEARIIPEHEHLMVDRETISMMGVPLRRTRQWSQRPHLASADYYRKMLTREFSHDAKCFIEDHMHSVAQAHPAHHRLAIYVPDEANMKRSVHLDGRAGEPKFDDSQRF